MRESTTTFTWMKRKRNLDWYLMKQRVTIRMKRVKVGTNSYKIYFIDKDLDAPLSRPTKKHDEDSTTSSKRDESPILKKASVSLRSTFYFFIFIIAMD